MDARVVSFKEEKYRDIITMQVFIYLFYQFLFLIPLFAQHFSFSFSSHFVISRIVLAITILASTSLRLFDFFLLCMYLTHKISPLHYYCYYFVVLLHPNHTQSTHENDRVPVKY
jgi:hypothetical protein